MIAQNMNPFGNFRTISGLILTTIAMIAIASTLTLTNFDSIFNTSTFFQTILCVCDSTFLNCSFVCISSNGIEAINAFLTPPCVVLDRLVNTSIIQGSSIESLDRLFNFNPEWEALANQQAVHVFKQQQKKTSFSLILLRFEIGRHKNRSNNEKETCHTSMVEV